MILFPRLCYGRNWEERSLQSSIDQEMNLCVHARQIGFFLEPVVRYHHHHYHRKVLVEQKTNIAQSNDIMILFAENWWFDAMFHANVRVDDVLVDQWCEGAADNR